MINIQEWVYNFKRILAFGSIQKNMIPFDREGHDVISIPPLCKHVPCHVTDRFVFLSIIHIPIPTFHWLRSFQAQLSSNHFLKPKHMCVYRYSDNLVLKSCDRGNTVQDGDRALSTAYLCFCLLCCLYVRNVNSIQREIL